MIRGLPFYITFFFGLTTFATLAVFIWTIRNATEERVGRTALPILVALFLWLVLQAVLSSTGIYVNGQSSLPPRLLLFGILPALLMIAFLFVTPTGRQWINSLPLRNMTYVHTVRIGVELVLFWLAANKAVPELMTFLGHNFDILAGITAPLIASFGWRNQRIGRPLLLIWNLVSLALLLNIVFLALLSAPSAFQKFGFDQPNTAILYFPFSWLPSFIVPVVLLLHLASIRQLLKN